MIGLFLARQLSTSRRETYQTWERCCNITGTRDHLTMSHFFMCARQAADFHWLVSHSGMSRITKGTVDDQLKIVRKNQQQPQGMGAASRR